MFYILHFKILVKVLVWMSWGVDSAIAAYILKNQGYEVVAGFMKNYVSDDGNCSTYNDAQEAIKVSNFLWIKIISFDLQKEYNEKIIKYIYAGYKQGITPNPDVLCNSLIKFDVFLQKALELWFDYIATGHYARIEEITKWSSDKGNTWLKKWITPTYKLLRWIDHTKDQSYFLAGLTQFQLSQSIFPIWWYTKNEIRKLAKEIGLPNAARKDSQGLCFIGNIAIKDFLLKKLPKKEGNIIDTTGKIVGKHEGAYFLTIGQRHGLNLPFKAYVIKTDVKKNIVVVGNRENEALFGKTIPTIWWHWIRKPYTLPTKIIAKLRYRQEPQEATLEEDKEKNIIIVFEEKQRAIAPGQTIVAYKDDECIGSGIITG